MTIKIQKENYYRKIWQIGDHVIDFVVEEYDFDSKDLSLSVEVDSETYEKIDDEYTYKITRSIFREFKELDKIPEFKNKVLIVYAQHDEHIKHFKKLGFKDLKNPVKDWMCDLQYYYVLGQ